MMADPLAHLAGVEDEDLAEARACSDALTLSERAEEAIAWMAVSLAEIASRCRDSDELVARFAAEPAFPSLVERWRSRRSP
jgi:hypothetical protein